VQKNDKKPIIVSKTEKTTQKVQNFQSLKSLIFGKFNVFSAKNENKPFFLTLHCNAIQIIQ